MNATAGQLERRYPRVNWREPVRVHVAGGVTRWCCRVCIAVSGLKASEVADQGFESIADARAHVLEHFADAA